MANFDIVFMNTGTMTSLDIPHADRRWGPGVDFIRAAQAISFFAKQQSITQVRVDFSIGLRSLAATTTPGNWTFAGPTAITTSSVTFTPGNSFLLLNLTGSFSTGTYTLSVAANTVESAFDAVFNTAGSSAFEVTAPGGSSAFNAGLN